MLIFQPTPLAFLAWGFNFILLFATGKTLYSLRQRYKAQCFQNTLNAASPIHFQYRVRTAMLVCMLCFHSVNSVSVALDSFLSATGDEEETRSFTCKTSFGQKIRWICSHFPFHIIVQTLLSKKPHAQS